MKCNNNNDRKGEVHLLSSLNIWNTAHIWNLFIRLTKDLLLQKIFFIFPGRIPISSYSERNILLYCCYCSKSKRVENFTSSSSIFGGQCSEEEQLSTNESALLRREEDKRTWFYQKNPTEYEETFLFSSPYHQERGKPDLQLSSRWWTPQKKPTDIEDIAWISTFAPDRQPWGKYLLDDIICSANLFLWSHRNRWRST